MRRNLDRRVEAVTPIQEKSLKNQIEKILKTYLNDTTNCWEMENNGKFIRTKGKSTKQCAQNQLMNLIS